MSIAINGKFTSQRITGVQRVAYELTRAMQMRETPGDELEVFVPQDAVEPGTSLKRKRRFPWLRGNLWEQITLPIAARRSTLVNLCNTNPLFKRRQVVMVHDMAVFDVPQAFSKKFLLWYRFRFSILPRLEPIILTISSFSKERICHHLRIDASRVAVLPPGADHLDRIVSDPAIIERLELSKDSYCVIVGSLDPRKNLQRVLDAVERLGHLTNLKFVIAGGRNPRVFNAARVGKPNDSKQVIWAGFVSDGELKALYESAACLVFPSLYEGFGLPPLEAMYCGCPVITSTYASIPEACGQAVMYCDATSVDDIAEKISLMLTDSELRQRYRTLGLRHAHEYRWDRAARELLEILFGEENQRPFKLAPHPSAG
jgi:glycosyltransferase involved in cell wall biosynthesis